MQIISQLGEVQELIRSFNVWNDDDVLLKNFNLEESEGDYWMGNVTLSLVMPGTRKRREVYAGVGPDGLEYSEDSFLDSASEFWCWMYFDYCDDKQP